MANLDPEKMNNFPKLERYKIVYLGSGIFYSAFKAILFFHGKGGKRKVKLRHKAEARTQGSIS